MLCLDALGADVRIVQSGSVQKLMWTLFPKVLSSQRENSPKGVYCETVILRLAVGPSNGNTDRRRGIYRSRRMSKKSKPKCNQSRFPQHHMGNTSVRVDNNTSLLKTMMLLYRVLYYHDHTASYRELITSHEE